MSSPTPVLSPAQLALYFDHTLLKPEASSAEIDRLCDEATRYGFFSVCINSSYVRQAAQKLAGSHVKVVSVVGFPLGACTTETKVFETQTARNHGAQEIDMVLAIGALKEGRAEDVLEDIRQVVLAAGTLPVKVILETCLLTQEEKSLACRLSQQAGAAFVKTSTGFSKSGATREDILLMRRAVGAHVGVKASGGIRTLAQTLEMITAGANRIGASAGVQILDEYRQGSAPAGEGAY